MKKQLLMKTFLVAVCMLVGGANAWGSVLSLYSQNYESATDASSWVTQSLAPTLVTGDATYGKYIQMSVGNNNSRSTYTTWGSAIYGDYKTYTLEFDATLTLSTGNTKNQSTSFAIMADGYALPTANYSYSSDYIFKITSVANSTTFSINEEGTTYEMPKDVWCHYSIVVDGDDGTATYTITNKSTSTQLATGTYNIPSEKGFKAVGMYYLSGRYWSVGKFDNISITTEVNSEVVTDPTIAITGVSGANRIVTITGGTSTDGTATVTTYYTTDGTDPTSSSSVYSSALTITEDCTIKAISISDKGGESNISSLVVTTGEITLNAPTISRSGNSVTITSDQSDIVGNPSATIYYTYGVGDLLAYSSSITVAADATITAYAAADGYTNSDNATRAVALFPTDVAKVIDAPENNTYTTGALSGVDVVGTNATFQALMIDGVQWGGEDVFVQSTKFGFRNGGAGKDWYFDDTNNVWLLVKNLKAGDIIVANTNYQASNLDNATYAEKYSEGNNRAYIVTADGDVELAFKKPGTKTMHYFYGLYVWSHSITKAITAVGWATYCSSYALDFTGDIANLTDVYIVTGANANSLVLSSVKGGTVPANTGLLLEGTAGDVVIPIVGSSDTDLTANKLVGVTAETVLDANDGYVLMGTPKVGFYQNSNAFTVGANTAYLPADFAATARSFYSFGDATAIKAIDNSSTSEAAKPSAQFAIDNYYNVAGQRVAAPTKGLYIKNGKKIVVK